MALRGSKGFKINKVHSMHTTINHRVSNGGSSVKSVNKKGFQTITYRKYTEANSEDSSDNEVMINGKRIALT